MSTEWDVICMSSTRFHWEVQWTIVVANGKAGRYCISYFPLCTHRCLRFQGFPFMCSNSAMINPATNLLLASSIPVRDRSLYIWHSLYSRHFLHEDSRGFNCLRDAERAVVGYLPTDERVCRSMIHRLTGPSPDPAPHKIDGLVVANGKAGEYCISHFPLCTHTCLRFHRFPVMCSYSAVVSGLLQVFCSQVRFRWETEIYKFGTHYTVYTMVWEILYASSITLVHTMSLLAQHHNLSLKLETTSQKWENREITIIRCGGGELE